MTASSAESKVTYLLEMESESDFQPCRREVADFVIQQVEFPCPEFNWFMHQAVGVDYRWGGREAWGKLEWTGYVNRPGLETWVAYRSGVPAGYFELECRKDGSVRIVCFGLRQPFIGQGLGGVLLTAAVRRAWTLGAARVWLTTCSHDHQTALKNYVARGFKVTYEKTGPPNERRESALFRSGATQSETRDAD